MQSDSDRGHGPSDAGMEETLSPPSSDSVPEIAEIDYSAPKPLCPQCMNINETSDHFCRKCGAPISSYATIDPIGRIWAEGYFYRQAVWHPRSAIVVIGIWMIFLPTILFSLMLVLSSAEFADRAYGIIAKLLELALVGLQFTILWMITRNYWRYRASLHDTPETKDSPK